jgi:hypothetical protein
MSSPLLFKVLVNGKSCNGGNLQYPAIGKWTEIIRNPKCCSSGYHLTTDPLRWWKPKAELYLAEGDGKINGDDSDKACFERVRLVERITPEWKYISMFPRVRCFLAASARSFDPKAEITWANLAGENLSEANLRGANLSGLRLWGVNFSESDLRGTNFSWSTLSWSNLSGANLLGAKFSGANLYRANFLRAYSPTYPPDGWLIDDYGYLFQPEELSSHAPFAKQPK